MKDEKERVGHVRDQFKKRVAVQRLAELTSQGAVEVRVNVGGFVYTSTDIELRFVPRLKNLLDTIDRREAVPRDANLIPYIDREPESMLQVFRYIENPENLPEHEEELDVLKADLEFYGFDTSNMGRPPKPASVPSSESVIRALLMTGGEGLLYGPKDVFPARRQ